MPKLVLVIFALSLLIVVPSASDSQTIGAGTSGGEFINPTPTCPPATCSGIGTNSLFFGIPDPGNTPNGLAFTGRGVFSAGRGAVCARSPSVPK